MVETASGWQWPPQVSAHAQNKDTGDQKRISRFHGQAATARENAAMCRAVADDVRTERALRTRIAKHHPALHQSEPRARAEIQQAQSARIKQQNQRCEPPAPSCSGPSRLHFGSQTVDSAVGRDRQMPPSR